MQPEPVLKPLASRTWELDAKSWEELSAHAIQVGQDLNYQVSIQPAGVLLQSAEFFGAQIDKYCVYPVINAKTGGRMHTFATWQMEMSRSLSYTGRATGVLVVEIPKAERPFQARTYCRAFTEMGIQPAESTGAYERELMQELGATSGSVTARPAPVAQQQPDATPPAPAESKKTPQESCDLDKELRKLGRLKADGLLTDEEFTKLKKNVLARCG